MVIPLLANQDSTPMLPRGVVKGRRDTCRGGGPSVCRLGLRRNSSGNKYIDTWLQMKVIFRAKGDIFRYFPILFHLRTSNHD